MLQLAVINRSHHPLPQYETPGAAGLDLRAFLPEPVTLKSLERKLIPTGLYLEIPMGYEAQIRPRSGLAIKKGLTLVNTPGTIDSDYRGELLVPVINLSAEDQSIEDGDRIAGAIFFGRTGKCRAAGQQQGGDEGNRSTHGGGSGWGMDGTLAGSNARVFDSWRSIRGSKRQGRATPRSQRAVSRFAMNRV